MEVFQTLLNVVACNRRKQEALVSTPQPDIVKVSVTASDSESTIQSTDPGDCSNAEFSDNSEQAIRSPEASDTEAFPQQLNSFGSIPPPPGLEAPSQLAARINRKDQHRIRTGTPLNSHAPLFVPGLSTEGCMPPTQQSQKPMRQTISLLKGLLQEWEAAIPEEQVTSDEHAFSALQERLSKLTPQEAAILRGFLESKESRQNDVMLQTWQTASTMLGMSNLSNQPVTPTQCQFATGVCGPHAGQILPPPGKFCHDQLPVVAPRTWKPPVEAGQTRTYTPFGSQSPGSNQPAKTVAPPTDDGKDTLRTNLRDLSLLDHERVLLVRKINRLGLESPQVLETYFSKFGAVERVMVSHSRAKSMFGRGGARIRPAGLGFVLMGSTEEVHSVLAHGPEHDVAGITVSVHPFESRPVDDAEAEGKSLQTE